ncbi:CgeB family protein [Larkinella rosea]|uniref:Glycosyltransferase family 1 protein n=1 Tax=Larkinella rosea TaxID=2025312 RepID=A0A3P1BTN0_9BACT|nr:glycosyltransferase [Larkinella rosea]RRB04263.1 glycosyltransferase family 1 protein [Larkinella rosea]
MTIVYIGDTNPSSTAFHRFLALKRLGHRVTIYNPQEACQGDLQGFLSAKIHFRTGYQLLQNRIGKWLTGVIDKTADLVWVDSGELIGPSVLKKVKATGVPVILYNVDDPTGPRDGGRFKSLLKALPFYDLVVVVRPETERECRQLGASKVLRVCRSYDEVAHKPYDTIDEIPAQFRSEIAFIGTWMRYEKRDEFLLKLIQNGLPVAIWGDRWQKSPHWNALKDHYRGGALGGRGYVGAIQGAKLCIGMLSKGNRDLHTQRSLEIPFIGGLFCAERTAEHTAMYREDVEAVFWKDVDECIVKCREMLADEQKRESIRLAGMRRVRENKVGNEDICTQILAELEIHQLI